MKETGEGGIASRKVFIDADKDGFFDSTERYTVSDASGNYSFKLLAAGSYRVREVLPSGWRRTSPSSSYYDVTLGSGASTSGKNFGSTQKVLISGSVFNDLDGDLMTFWRVLRDRTPELVRAAALTPHSRAEALHAYEPTTDELETARRVWVILTQCRSGTLRRTGWRHFRT